MAAGDAAIDRDDEGDYLRGADYKAELERLKARFPNLLGYRPAAAKQLTWMGENLGRLERWYEDLPADRRATLSSPLATTRAYEADEAKRAQAAESPPPG